MCSGMQQHAHAEHSSAGCRVQQRTWRYRLAVRQRCGHRIVQVYPVHPVVCRQVQRSVHLRSSARRILIIARTCGRKRANAEGE